jgi:chemotaxis protein MotB
MPRRARKHEEQQESHERWLVSYADFITLLFAFFVVMYAISSVSEGKYRVLSDSMVAAFRNVTVNSTGLTIATQPVAPSAPRQIAPKRNAKAEEQKRQARERMQHMAEEILAALGSLVKEGEVSVTEGPNGLSVEINSSVLFPPGDAQLESRAASALRAVARVIAPTQYAVTVEGHTDTTPISTPHFPSNWELSVVRASTVIRLFVDAGVEPQRLAAMGYGEQRPLASNDTPEGRARNRRVTITIAAGTTDTPSQIPLASPLAEASMTPTPEIRR